MEKFFLVWSPQGARPPTCRHPTMESAHAEAVRLAGASPGAEFFVLEAMGVARKVEVQWTAFEGCPDIDGIPF